MSKKPALLHSSALSNSDAMGIVSDDVIREQARIAFADKVQSSILEGSAVQRLAYAIMAEHFTMNQGGAKLPALESMLPSTDKAASDKAATTLFDALLAFFSPRPLVAEKGSNERIEEAKASQVAREQLLKRALLVAAILARGGVSVGAFNLDTGTFTVPCKLLLKADEKPRGRILDNPLVALDGRTILLSRKPTIAGEDPVDDKAQASVTRLVKVNAAPKPRKAKPAATTAKVPDLAAPLAALLNSEKEMVHLFNLPKDVQSHLAAIALWYDRESKAAADAVNADKADGAKRKAANA